MTSSEPREYSLELTAYGLDAAAAESLFDRVADAAHALDEEVTVTGGFLAAPSNGENSSRPSPGADPRVEAAVMELLDHDHNGIDCRPTEPLDVTVTAVLAAADAADRAEGIVRVDTRDEAMVERLAERVHEAWMTEKRRQGITSRPAENGEEQMVPYHYLSEPVKNLDRANVRAVLAALAGEQ